MAPTAPDVTAPPPQVEINIGYGQLSIKGENLPLNEKDLEKLETELLIDEDLAKIVTGENSIQIFIDSPKLKGNPFEGLKLAIKGKLSETLAEIEKKEQEQQQEETREEEDSVRIGRHFVISGDDSLADLIQKWHFLFDGQSDQPLWRFQRVAKAVFDLLWFTTALLIGMLAFYFAPDFHKRVNRYLRSSFPQSFGWSVLTTLALMPVSLALMISIVGWPLLPLMFSLGILFAIFGYVHLAWFVGEGVGHLISSLGRKGPWEKTFVGLLVLLLVAQFSWVGGTILLLGSMAGTGAVIYIFMQRFFSARRAG